MKDYSVQRHTKNNIKTLAPNWLIAIELFAGISLLYVSSSALIETDMHISVRPAPANTIQRNNNAMLQAQSVKTATLLASIH
jgi:hypothetical protein